MKEGTAEKGRGRMRRVSWKVVCVLTAALLTLCGCGKEQTGETAKKTMENSLLAGGKQAIAIRLFAGIEPIRLAGTTFSIMGDSISTYEGYNPVGYNAFFPEYGDVKHVEDTWWKQVADDLELILLANDSSSGATVTGDSTETDNPQCACNEFRTSALAGPGDTCPDRIIVYLGANDVLEAMPLGNNDGTRPVKEGEITTFSDAYTLMLDKLQAKYPLALIYCCTLQPIGEYGTETPYVEFVNGIGLTVEDYGKVIAGIAEARGYSVIDLYNCGITVENLQEMSSDGLHPNDEGMRCIAGAVEEALSCR